MHALSTALLLVLACGLAQAALRPFNIDLPKYGLKIKGHFDGRKASLEFQGDFQFIRRTLMIYFKKKSETEKCPGLVFLFSYLVEVNKIAYVAGGCTGKDNLKEPEMHEKLAIDWDREEDSLKDGALRFKGTIEYDMDLSDFGYDKFDTIQVRGQIPENNFQVTFDESLAWPTKVERQ